MSDVEREASAIGLFALACESLNEFARSMRESSLFSNVKTGSDIRYYETGWRLEKWVEAEINKTEERWVVWWLELGHESGRWILQSHLAISPQGEFISIPDRFANSPTELKEQLRIAVEGLTTALVRNSEFASAVEQARN
jgi:hypothetical protein